MEKARKFLFKPGPAREHGEQPTAMPEPTDTKPGPGVDDKGHGTKWPGVKAASPGTDNKPPDGKRGPGGPETPRDVSRTKASGPGTPQGARAAAAPPADDAKGDPARLELVKHMLFAALGLEDEPAPPVNAMPEPATTKSAGASTGTGDKGHGTKWPGAKAASPSTDNKPPSAPAGAKASSLLKPGPGGTTGQGVPPKPTYPPSPPAALRVTPARPTHGGNTAQNDGGEGVKGAPKVPETTKPVLGTTADRRGQSESPPQIYPAEPATVLAVSGKGVEYEFDGEAPKFKTRGEIRSLKAFTRAMTGKQKLLASHSDRGKKIKAEAGELASEVGNLRDAARTVHGGERLLKRLDQLHEAAKLTSAKAVDMDTALHKGSETVRTLITNADARHGIIFRAVVDSDLTEPAEREFYLDKEGS
ncbi:hypothetical protein [Kitasatospora sp. NPDC094016]|uniref:hypothetical protein n=1 Tax=Kitasatospora sp. NPDC094016 TaxID=3154986 RepID=UPI0033336D29